MDAIAFLAGVTHAHRHAALPPLGLQLLKRAKAVGHQLDLPAFAAPKFHVMYVHVAPADHLLGEADQAHQRRLRCVRGLSLYGLELRSEVNDPRLLRVERLESLHTLPMETAGVTLEILNTRLHESPIDDEHHGSRQGSS